MLAQVGLLVLSGRVAQLVLSGDLEPKEARLQLIRGIEQLAQVFLDADSQTRLAQAAESVLVDQHYEALRSLRALLPLEARLLAGAGHA